MEDKIRCKDCGITLDGEYELQDERCANCQADYERLPKNYILMRFYDGGGLADWLIVKCKEEDLDEHLVKFEEDCVSQNLGTMIGVLEENEFKQIANLYDRVIGE